MPGGSLTESQLIETCRAGDRAAAAALVRLHQDILFRTVLRLVGRWAVAEEIAQEALLRMLQHIEEIDAARGARGWLLSVGLNLARKQVSRTVPGEVSRFIRETDVLAEPSTGPDPERQVMAAEEWRRFEDALGKLSPKLREVIVLHYIEGLPFRDIAGVLGTPVASLKMRAHRARNQLAELLGRSHAMG